MVKENSYINIQAFMVNDLHLKGNELLIYAIIHGFSQDGESQFTGSLQYLADWCNASKQTVITALQSLCEKQLLLKNVEYKNNLKFCTYKTSIVVKNFERGSQNSLMGWSKNLNEGSQNFLPNNINNNINNKLEDTEKAPSYIKEKEKIINQSVSKEYQNLQEQMFNIISEHNSKVDNSKKIPISKNYWQFVCKESRMFLDKIGTEEKPDDVLQALKNFISLTLRRTWQKNFSWKMFVNNYRDYTPEFFNISKYIDTPKNEEEIKIMTQSFADENLMKDWFNYAIFHHNRKKWIQAGQPEGEDFKKWADDCLCEDVKNGRANPDGDYI